MKNITKSIIILISFILILLFSSTISNGFYWFSSSGDRATYTGDWSYDDIKNRGYEGIYASYQVIYHSKGVFCVQKGADIHNTNSSGRKNYDQWYSIIERTINADSDAVNQGFGYILSKRSQAMDNYSNSNSSFSSKNNENIKNKCPVRNALWKYLHNYRSQMVNMKSCEDGGSAGNTIYNEAVNFKNYRESIDKFAITNLTSSGKTITGNFSYTAQNNEYGTLELRDENNNTISSSKYTCSSTAPGSFSITLNNNVTAKKVTVRLSIPTKTIEGKYLYLQSGSDYQNLVVVTNMNETTGSKVISGTVELQDPNTNISINKYITKVNNTAVNGRDTNKSSTVYVDKGDTVEFTIKLKNTSSIAAKATVTDTLPSDTSNLKIDGVAANSANVTKTVTANGVASFRISYTVGVSSGTQTNTAKITKTVSTANEDIANDSSTTSSSDKYTIRSHNVSVNKYILRNNGSDVSPGRSAYSTTQKRNSPVQVDKGDTLTYYISIHNAATSSVTASIKDTIPDNATVTGASIYNGSSWVNLSYTQNGRDLTFNANVPASKYTQCTINLRVDSTTGATVENKVEVTGVKNSHNYAVTNNSNEKTSSDYYTLRTYNVSVNKYILRKNDVNISPSRSAYNNSQKQNSPVMIDAGDKLTYYITVQNSSNNIANVSLKDTIPANSQIVGATYYNGSAWVNLTYSRNGQEVTMNVSVGANAALSITIDLKLNGTTGTKVENKMEVIEVKNVHNYTVTNNSTQKTSSDFHSVYTYSMSINKYITKIGSTSITGRNSNKTGVVKADTGDIVEFTIAINNTGTGVIKDVRVSDSFSTGLEYVSSTGSGYTWSMSGTTGSGVYTNEIQPSTTVYMVIKLKVTEISETEGAKSNTVTTTEYKNKNNIVVTTNTPSSSDSFTRKSYKAGINKYITKVGSATISGRNTNKTPKIEAEPGDVIEYKIVVSNTGTGELKNIEITDTFTNGLVYVSHADTSKWTKSGNTLKFNGTILAGGSSTITLYLRVEAITTTQPTLTNTAQVVKIYNKNDIDVTKSNPQSSDSVTLVSYDISMNKYVQTINGVTVSNRANENDKYNHPVETESQDIVRYALRVKNSGTANIKSFEIRDVLESGMSFSSNYVVSVYRYNSDGSGQTDVSGNFTHTRSGNTVTGSFNTYLMAGEYVEITLEATVDVSNMYLEKIENDAVITKIVNKNDYEISLGNTGDTEDKEYVKLKDLMFRGTVWYDTNEDGIIDADEGRVEGSPVKVYNADTGTVEYQTTTGADGVYIFPAVDKATNKDGYGNYTPSSVYKNYYVEIEYNGIRYRDTKYAGRTGITEDAITEEYKVTSHASEFEDVRLDFNKKFATITENMGISNDGATTPMEYEKTGNISTLKTTDNIPARTFIVEGSSSTDAGANNYIYLYHSGQTEYLKYMNLGLVERPTTDLESEKTVVEAKVMINGYEGIYTINSQTGTLELYKSDYNYRYDQYENEEVQNAKGEESELKVEITYKIRVTNKSDIPTEVKEIVDYYDSELKEYKSGSGRFEASIGTTGSVTVSPNSSFSGTKTFSNFKTNYITGMNVRLIKDDYVDIFVTYVVDKDSTRAIYLDLADTDIGKKNVAEVNAYSTYNDGSDETPGLVDGDSAPGNSDPNKPEEFEDDTALAALKIILKSGERKTNGFVWEDYRNIELDNKQVVGDGIYAPTGEEGKTDKPLQGVTAKIVESIVVDGVEYEETIKTWDGSVVEQDTDINGEYKLESYIPGIYKIKFEYGRNEATISQGYTGQDYKSSTYQAGFESITDTDGDGYVDNEYHDLSNATLNDAKVSDARDSEIRRLEVIKYSEQMINQKCEVLNSGTTTDEALKTILKEETGMDARTAKVNVGLEENLEIKDIDFAIEKRPYTELELKNRIKEITLTRSDGKVLLQANYTYTKNVDGTENCEVDGIGIEHIQAVDNTDTVQGFRYINMDENILRGAVVELEFEISVINNSQVDTVNNRLITLGSAEAALTDLEGRTDYQYGDYLGKIYYTGKNNTDDVYSVVKIDKVVDYVDNTLTFRTEDNSVKDKSWTPVDEATLKDNGLIGSSVFYANIENGATVDRIVDRNGVLYTTEGRSNIAISNAGDEHNEDLSKNIIPSSVSSTETEYTANVIIGASKVLDPDVDGDEMRFENLSEIIQYTSTTGRKPVTTLGSANPANWEATREVDTDQTESVTITPPTGTRKILVIENIPIFIGIGFVIAIVSVVAIKKKRKKNK